MKNATPYRNGAFHWSITIIQFLKLLHLYPALASQCEVIETGSKRAHFYFGIVARE